MLALVLPVGDERYAVDITSAREVVTAPDIVTLPTAPARVLGLFNVRGELIPIFDTAALLGLAPVGDVSFAAIVETTLGVAALATTGLGEAVELGEPVGNTDSPGAVASYEVGSNLVVLLDLEALLAPLRTAS